MELVLSLPLLLVETIPSAAADAVEMSEPPFVDVVTPETPVKAVVELETLNRQETCEKGKGRNSVVTSH